jgi:cobalamin biosynthesis protein CbiM
MHIPDHFLQTQTSIPLLGAAFVAVAHAFRKVRAALLEKMPVLKAKLAGMRGDTGDAAFSGRLSRRGKERIMRMAAVGSLIFAFQMVNFPIASGTSGHLLGGVLAALVAGPFEALLIMAVILATQSFFFADGGLLALGANIINMGLVGAIGGYYLYVLVLKQVQALPNARTLAIAVAAWTSVVLAAAAASLELAASGTVVLGVVLPVMLQYHALIGIGEALITVGIIGVLTRYRYPMFLAETDDSFE